MQPDQDTLILNHQEFVTIDRIFFVNHLKIINNYLRRIRNRGNFSLLSEADLLIIQHSVSQLEDFMFQDDKVEK